jgi:hypothetical protein
MPSEKKGEKINGYNICILISTGMKFRNKNKFRYRVPTYTGLFRVLPETVGLAALKEKYFSPLMTPKDLHLQCPLCVCSLFNDAFSVNWPVQHWMKEWQVNDELATMWKAGLIEGTILAFAWRDWVKLRKPSVRITGLRAGIWIGDLPSTKQECQPLDHDFRSFVCVCVCV